MSRAPSSMTDVRSLRNSTGSTAACTRYGSQAIVVAIDAKRQNGRFEVYARSGTTEVTFRGQRIDLEPEAVG
jgi:imidazole glycerol phosphate synthase subunit HisF